MMMSKINITFDTVTKKASVQMDGNEMNDCSSVYLYKYSDGLGQIEISCGTYNEDEKVYTQTRVVASENELKGTKLEKGVAVEKFPVSLEEKYAKAVSNWLTRK
jgi:hypothetical protein